MSTNYHTAITVGAAANAATINTPLGTLDTALTAEVATRAAADTSINATLSALQDSVILGGAAVTLVNDADNVAAAQKVIDVDSTAQFVAGCTVEYMLISGILERNTVGTVTSGTRLTMVNNVGATGIADNAPVSVVPIGAYHASIGIYNVLDYGAHNDGTDAAGTTAAIQAAIDAANTAEGGLVYLPAGTYTISSTIHLPLDSDVAITISGVGDYRIGSATQAATIINVSQADGTDGFNAISTNAHYPTYSFRDLAIVGPDPEAPRTTLSGNGIAITGTAIPRVNMTNVYVSNFYGKSAVWLDNCEYGLLQNCYFNYNKYGLRMSTATNAYTFINVDVCYSSHIGIWFDGTVTPVAGLGQAWIGGLVQNNERTGIYFNGAGSIHFTGLYMEGNNTLDSATDYPIRFAATTGNANQNIQFSNSVFYHHGSGHDDDFVYATGASGYVNNNVTFASCLFGGSADTAPLIHHADAYSTNWIIVNTTAAANCTLATGQGNVVIHNGQITGLEAVSVTGNLTLTTIGNILTLVNADHGVLYNNTLGGIELRGGAGAIWTGGTTGGTEYMRLTTTGLGIGDAAPAEKLDVTGNINATGVIKIDDVQVVKERQINAACDDAINASAWDATTAGVLTALRDAMIAHGLIAAA